MARLSLHKSGLEHLLLHLKGPLAFFELSLGLFQLFLELDVLILHGVDIVLHVATFLFAFATAEAGTFPIFEEPVLLRW